jgi:hypothetical protein
MRHLYEISLSEKELAEIIRCLRLEAVSTQTAAKLAQRMEAELWAPYHESVALGKSR